MPSGILTPAKGSVWIEAQELLSYTTICRVGWEGYFERKGNGLTQDMRIKLAQELSAVNNVIRHLVTEEPVSVRERFVELANRWRDETDYLSSPLSITSNDTYMKIISMGEPVIPLILQDLQERGGNWYRALRILSGVDPVSPEVRGDMPKMKEAWFSWGRDRHYIK